MLPAVLDILTRRLEIIDRKRMRDFARIRADLWTRWRDPETHPDPFTESDFLPETAADRRRRAQAEAEANRPPTKEELEVYKRSFMKQSS
jgi:hypothetical protein